MGDAGGNDVERVHVHVSGHVQGVGFRYDTRRKAADVGVAGWVKNLPGGRVEAVFEGPSEAVKEMVSWCESGPPGAEVEDVSVEGEPPEGLSRFEIR